MHKPLILLVALSAFTAAKRSTRVHHGSEVSKSELTSKYPFVAYVLSCKSGESACASCTGSLIKPDVVLLASHCFCLESGGEPDDIKVYFKAVKGDQGTAVVGHLEKRMPFNCNSRGFQASTDLAKVKLAKKMDITPVPLECDEVDAGKDVTIIGYGYDHRGYIGWLRKGERQITACPPGFRGIHCISFGSEARTDSGDSGGPLLIAKGSGFAQVGVLSGFVKSRRHGDHMTYPKVSDHCDWIKRG